MNPSTTGQALRELNLDGIELGSGKWDGSHLGLANVSLQKQWLTVCDKNDLKIPALGVNALCGQGMSKPQKAQTMSAILADAVNIAQTMQIPCLQLPSFFDTQNPWAIERLDVPETLQGEYDYLHPAAHVKDGRGNALSSALLGQGDSQFKQTMDVFSTKQYAGWFILENDYHKIPEVAHWKANIQQDMATVRRIMQG